MPLRSSPPSAVPAAVDADSPARSRAGGAPPRGRAGRLRSVLPGLALCLGVALLAELATSAWASVSALLPAIVVGALLGNLVRLPDLLTPGIDLAARTLLRAGIVLLGLELVLGDVLSLGLPMLLVVLVIVGGGIAGTLALGRALGVDRHLTLLVACGFSICGAAAVAAAAGVSDPEGRREDRTVSAVALVVVMGTAMIALVPLASAALGLDSQSAARWAGGSVHEVAQVVAVGGILGGGALSIAVLVKLARVLLLAPVMMLLAMQQRRAAARSRTDGDGDAAGRGAAEGARRPPLVPLFVLGFLAMVALRSLLPLPELALDAAGAVRSLLLGAAMVALGTGVRIHRLIGIGVRPVVLALAATALVSLLALGGVLLAA